MKRSTQLNVFRLMAAALICTQLAVSTASAQQRSTPPEVRENRAVWTAVGAGAGFGLGVYAGFLLFDDALCSDRKVWTTAILSAIAGGVVGNLLARQSRDPVAPAVRPLTVDPQWQGRLRIGDVRTTLASSPGSRLAPVECCAEKMAR